MTRPDTTGESSNGIGPGAYDSGSNFGDNAKTFKIPEKREMPIADSAGPGQYNAEQAEEKLRHKSPTPIFAKGGDRPKSFAN